MTPAAARARLVDIIAARSFQRGANVTLASGRTSSIYFNLKPTMLDPEGAHLIARLVLDALAGAAVDRIGGLEMGAVPMAAAVAAVSYAEGRPLPAFFVRKQTKEHGTKSLIEGLAPHESLEGQRVAILEDVTTSGHSALRAAAAAQAAGAVVVRVITIVDRLEGAAETFAAAGLPFTPLVTLRDFN